MMFMISKDFQFYLAAMYPIRWIRNRNSNIHLHIFLHFVQTLTLVYNNAHTKIFVCLPLTWSVSICICIYFKATSTFWQSFWNPLFAHKHKFKVWVFGNFLFCRWRSINMSIIISKSIKSQLKSHLNTCLDCVANLCLSPSIFRRFKI